MNHFAAPAPSVIFDLDGTLVDSEPHYYEAGRQVLAAHGVSGFTWEEHTRFVGIGTRETMQTLREEYGIAAPVEQLLAEKNRAYLALAHRSTEPFPGMRELVKLLEAAGAALAVASGSSRAAIDAVLVGTGLAPLFPVRVSAEEVERGKPEPDVFVEAARRLGVRPADCVALEDAPAGVEAARRAGMRCVAVPSVPGTAEDPAFAAAALMFPGGPGQFDPHRAYAWITGDGGDEGDGGAG
jgi:beta-phosphoglucomutase family hydrolase